MTDLESLVDQVLAVDSTKNRADVLVDLKHTRSANATINRILDGQFLKGTERDPSSRASKQTAALIILDSDEEEEAEEHLKQLPSSSRHSSITANSLSNDKSKVRDDWDKRTSLSSPPLPSSTVFDFNNTYDDDILTIPTKRKCSNNQRTRNTTVRNEKEKQAETTLIDGGKDDLDSMEKDIPMRSSKSKGSVISSNMPENEIRRVTHKSRKDNIILDDDDDKDNDELQLPSLPSLSDITMDKEVDDIEEGDILGCRRKSFDFIDNAIVDYGDFGLEDIDDDDSLIDLNTKRPLRDNNKIDLLRYNLGSDEEDDVDHLPSTNDFFEELMTQKLEKPTKSIDIFEIEDSEDEDTISISKDDRKGSSALSDRKGKRKATSAFWDDEDDIDTTSPRQRARYDDEYSSSRASSVDTTLSAKEKKKLEAEERKRQRAEAAEEKKRKKAQLAEERKRLKEQKQLEKERQQLFEKENRIRNNRNQILKEMIVDIHPGFLASKPGQLIERVLHAKEAEVVRLDSKADYTVRWRRKTNSEWDVDSQAFIPITHTKVVCEPFILVYLTALQFAERIQQKTMDSLIDMIAEPNHQTLLLIEGLDQYYKKKLLHIRRQYDDQIRSAFESQEDQQQGSSSSRRKTNISNEVIANGPDQATIEEYSIYLMLVKNVMFVPTKDDEDTASWIESLTTDLALGRYKSKNINNSYRVSKCGTDPQDTYIKMLQEIQLCTPSVAKSVISAYPSVQRLHRAYDGTRGTTAAELMLADLEVERSALQTRDRKINRVMSRKIYSIFTSDDPEEIIY